MSCDGSEVTTGIDRHIGAVFAGHVMWNAAVVARGHSYLHAAAVTRAGVAIIFPGEANTGKTTLCEELLRRGFGYLSDEFALVDDLGMVRPFPRALRFDDDEGSRWLNPHDLGVVESSDVPPALVVLTRFEPGASPAFEPPMSAGVAVAALVDHCPSMIGSPEATLRRLARLAERCVVVKATRGEAEEFVEHLCSELPGLMPCDR